MTRVVAAVDPGPVAGAVAAVARRLAAGLGAEPVALWVTSAAGSPTLAPAVDLSPVVHREGDPATEVAAEVAGADVVAAVVGLRTVPGGPRPAGHVAEHLITVAAVPVAVVPPEAAEADPGRGPVLVPVEGGVPPSPAMSALLAALSEAGHEVVPLHVFDRTTAPMFWNGWHDRAIWSDEFSQRYAPAGSTSTELRAGEVAREILAATEARSAGMIVLEWSRNLAHPHARVVRELLSNTRVPLLLVPAGS
jgi:hypothetical protein